MLENAHAVPKDGSPTTTPALHQTQCGASVAPAHYAGVRLHYPGDLPGRCVRRRPFLSSFYAKHL